MDICDIVESKTAAESKAKRKREKVRRVEEKARGE